MPTLKRKNADGNWEYIQVSGLDVSQLRNDVDSNTTALAESAQHQTDWINVKKPPYNAKGDGTTDDTVAIQTAINDAYTKKVPVYFPTGRYRVVSTITLPARIELIGNSKLSEYAYPFSTNCSTSIETESNPVFVGSTPGTTSNLFTCKLSMRGLAFYDKNESVNTVFLDCFNLFGGSIFECGFRSYGTIIRGTLNYLTRIHFNTFLDIRKSVITNRDFTQFSGITDSYILNNYINASIYSLSTKLIDVHYMNLSVFSHNFCDFAYNVMNLTSGHDNQITNNIFDYSYRGIILSALGGFTITDNNFTHINKKYATTSNRWMVTPDTNMTTKAWTGILLNYQCADMIIKNNFGDSECEELVPFRGTGYKRIETGGNRVSGKTLDQSAIMARALDTNYTGDGTDLKIQELIDYEVTTLPSANITTGGAIASFHGQTLFYNGKRIRNDNGTWKDMMGATVS